MIILEHMKKIECLKKQFRIITYKNNLIAISSRNRGFKKKSAIIYSHGKFIEDFGINSALNFGYDLYNIMSAVEKAGYFCFIPLRPKDTKDNEIDIIENAIEYLKKKKLPNIGIIAYSKGANLAINTPAINNLSAAVIIAPRMKEDTINRINAFKVPLLLILGANEKKAFRQNPKKNKKEIKIYRQDHIWFWQPRGQYWTDSINFIKKTMAK